MKKIIDGRVYDTEKAQYLGADRADCGGSDFRYWTEELYLKRTGEYFLFGSGGPMSRYAWQIETSSWVGGTRIMPLTYDEAKLWAEEHLGADKYIELFGDPEPDDDSTEIMTISIPASAARRIRTEAQQTGTSISALIASKFG